MSGGTDGDRLQKLLDRIADGEKLEVVLAEAGDDLDAASCALLATRLAEVLPATPDTAFRARLQTVLQHEMRSMHATDAGSRPRRRLWPVLRRLAPQALSLIVAVSLVMASAVVASADSLPGDSLYGVKRSVEGARVQLALTPEQRTDAHQHQADERLWELRQLVARGDDVELVLVDDLRDAQGAALDAAMSGEAWLQHEAESNAAETIDALSDLAHDVGPELQPAVQSALDTMRQASGGGAAPDPAVVPAADPSSVPDPVVTTVSTGLPAGVTATTAARPTQTAVGLARTATATALLLPAGSPTPPAPANTRPPIGPSATAVVETPVPATSVPETPEPTLEREGGRFATLAAEAAGTATAEASGPTSQSVGPQQQFTPEPTKRAPRPTAHPTRPPRRGVLIPPRVPPTRLPSHRPTERPAP